MLFFHEDFWFAGFVIFELSEQRLGRDDLHVELLVCAD
jgi:hypothetical protein